MLSFLVLLKLINTAYLTYTWGLRGLRSVSTLTLHLKIIDKFPIGSVTKKNLLVHTYDYIKISCIRRNCVYAFDIIYTKTGLLAKNL